MTENEPHITNDLLAKYFAEELTPEEKAAVDNWVASSADNRTQLDQLRTVWLDTGAVMLEEAKEYVFNENLAWEKVKARKQASAATGRRGSRWMLRIAASVVFVLAAAYLFKTFVSDPGELEALAASEVKTLELADGSVITLNTGSSLSYPEAFAGEKRQVKLRGEAFFEVEHNPERPFVVKAGAATIEVLGTSFNVAMETNGDVEVAVETGKVLFSAGDRKLLLEAGQRGIYESAKKVTTLADAGSASPAGSFWRTRRLVFSGHSLAEVADALEQAYGVDIQLKNNALANCSLSVTFENDSISNILEVIALTLELDVERNGDAILLSGTGCPAK